MKARTSGSGASGLRGAACLCALAAGARWAEARDIGFEYLGSSNGPGGTFDVLADGRVVAVVGDSILVESAPGSGVYETAGTMAAGTISPFGAAFISLSPDGTRLAIGDGNYGGGRVHIVSVSGLNGGQITPISFQQENYEAAWVDNDHLAVTYGNPSTFLGEVGILSLGGASSGAVLVIGGASAGVAMDRYGMLITGNGFDYLAGGSEAGDIKAYDRAALAARLEHGDGPLDFDATGLDLGRVLSAGSLEFDEYGNLFVGGANFGLGEWDMFALFTAEQYAQALAGSIPLDLSGAFSEDPSGELFSSYIGRYNAFTHEWLIADFGNMVLHRYGVVPVPGSAVILGGAWIAATQTSCRARTGKRGIRSKNPGANVTERNGSGAEIGS